MKCMSERNEKSSIMQMTKEEERGGEEEAGARDFEWLIHKQLWYAEEVNWK